MQKPTNTVQTVYELVTNYEHCKRRVSQAERELNNAKTDLDGQEKLLGKFMCPTDAKPGEEFNIWYGSSLMCVKVLPNGFDYSIRWRIRVEKDFI